MWVMGVVGGCSGLSSFGPDDTVSMPSPVEHTDSDVAMDSESDLVEDTGAAAPSCEVEDVCTPEFLRIDRCAAEPQALLCTVNSHELCATATCGGQRYACQEREGQYAWTVDLSCDDGDLCTFDDRCDRGTCVGTPVSCASSGCVTRTCNGTATCDEGPRTGGSCDDGDLCTYDDRCEQGSCVGTPVSCADGECVSRTCNGTAVCAEAPRRVGQSCDDGDACTLSGTCSPFGVCGGGPSIAVCGDGTCECEETYLSCPQDCPFELPPAVCASGTQSRDGCVNARVIGRSSAQSGWSSGLQDTCTGALNRHRNECGTLLDAGFDHTYTLFLLEGEQVRVELAAGAGACVAGDRFESRLKLSFNPFASGSSSACGSFEGCWEGPSTGDAQSLSRTFTAPEDGWLRIIVDGGAPVALANRGFYTLTAQLLGCESLDCGCGS